MIFHQIDSNAILCQKLYEITIFLLLINNLRFTFDYFKSINMKKICISDYKEIKEIIEKFNYETDNNILFRGEPKSLVPSIVDKCSFNYYADLVVKEKSLLEEFNEYSHIKYSYKKGNERDWEIRIAAREYGLASSLMDWTNSLDIALEFAIHDFLSKQISFTSLWILDRLKFDKLSVSSNCTLNFDEIFTPTIIQYQQYSEESYYRRKSIQGGYFLKQPYQDVTIPLNSNPFYLESLTQIIIPNSAVGNIWKNIASKIDLDKDACISLNNSDVTLSNICYELNKKFK
jgi:hypothetical protein